MDRLPFSELWAVDFEFRALPGERPVPVCMVAKELRSGRLLRRWRDELPARPPFPVDQDTLFIAYAAQAELGCFLELGWPMPARILDLYAEFCETTNGWKLPLVGRSYRSLLAALSWHGISAITSEEKTAGRALAMQDTWTDTERAALLDYCQTDVDPLGPLLQRMLPAIRRRPESLGHALLRGRYTAAVAAMERTGVPIDTVMLGRLRRQWHPIQRDLIRVVDKDYGVFDGATFKADRFEAWLAEQGIPWPRTPAGRLALDRDTFKAAGNVYPQVSPLRELRHSLSEMRLEKLAVGPDGRNRVSLMPFAARSSRNLCKTCLLGSNYGMGAASLAQRTGTSMLVAEATQRALALAFPVFWQWAEHMTDIGELRGELHTVFGWALRVTRDTRSTTLRNFPMQANAAEMLRLACCLATERGVQVCAPVHDALLVEADAADLGGVISITRAAMSEAARMVLRGVDVATEATVVTWPERYADPRGAVMWERVAALLDEWDARSPADRPYVSPPKPIRKRTPKGSGERRGLVGQIRCTGCGKWIRRRPAAGDWAEAERAYAGDEYEEHYCEADFGHALDPASDEEWAAWEASEVGAVNEVGSVAQSTK